jgi:hypothetical protein
MACITSRVQNLDTTGVVPVAIQKNLKFDDVAYQTVEFDGSAIVQSAGPALVKTVAGDVTIQPDSNVANNFYVRSAGIEPKQIIDSTSSVGVANKFLTKNVTNTLEWADGVFNPMKANLDCATYNVTNATEMACVTSRVTNLDTVGTAPVAIQKNLKFDDVAYQTVEFDGSAIVQSAGPALIKTVAGDVTIQPDSNVANNFYVRSTGIEAKQIIDSTASVGVAGNVLKKDALNNLVWTNGPTPVEGVVYVAKNGSDVTGKGTEELPFQTITYALTQLTGGVFGWTIFIAPGIYTENLTITRSNVTFIGQTSDTQQANKAVTITGNHSITTLVASGNETNSHIVFNNLSLRGPPAGGTYLLSNTGRGYSLTLNNCVLSQEAVGFSALYISNAVDSVGGTFRSRTYINNVAIAGPVSSASAIDFNAGQIWQIQNCDITAKGTGLALNVVSGNAWVLSAVQSAFTGGSGTSKVMFLGTNNQTSGNLCAFTECTFQGVPVSATDAMIDVGTGVTIGAFSFTRCTFINNSTGVASDYPFINVRPLCICTTIDNTFASIKTTTVNFLPFYSATPATSSVRWTPSTYASGNVTGTDTVTFPSLATGWGLVDKLKTEVGQNTLYRPTGMFYVAKNGSDTQGDGSYLNPWLTVQNAITVVDALGVGGNINIGPGTYTENLTLTKNINLVGTPEFLARNNEGTSNFPVTTITGTITILNPANAIVFMSNLRVLGTISQSASSVGYIRLYINNGLVARQVANPLVSAIALTNNIANSELVVTNSFISSSSTGAVIDVGTSNTSIIVKDSTVAGGPTTAGCIISTGSAYYEITGSDIQNSTFQGDLIRTTGINGGRITNNNLTTNSSGLLGVPITFNVASASTTVVGGNIFVIGGGTTTPLIRNNGVGIQTVRLEGINQTGFRGNTTFEFINTTNLVIQNFVVIGAVYGSFSSTVTQTQTAQNTPYVIIYNTTDERSGNIVFNPGTGQIVVPQTGTYRICTSIQFDTVTGGANSAIFWLRKNGTDVANTSSRITIATSSAATLAMCEYIVDANATEFFEICFASADASMSARAFPATTGTPPAGFNSPATPSIITTVLLLS